MNRRVSMWGLVMIILGTCTLIWPTAVVSAETTKPDPWAQIRILAGGWAGTSEGQGGKGTVRRDYAFVLKNRYLHETNTSTYPPQGANMSGEIHQHWSLFSYDRMRKSLMLRQFHEEGFVNQYRLTASESSPGKLVFDSENFENFDSSWKARETYEFLSPDEFIETFELGEPGQALQLYSRNHFKRTVGKP